MKKLGLKKSRYLPYETLILIYIMLGHVHNSSFTNGLYFTKGVFMKPMIEIYWNETLNVLIGFEIRKRETTLPLAYMLNSDIMIKTYYSYPKIFLVEGLGWQKIGEL